MSLFYFEKSAPGPEIHRPRLRVNMNAVKRLFGIRSPSKVYRIEMPPDWRPTFNAATPNAAREAAGLPSIVAVPPGGGKLGEYFPQVITCPRCGHETIDTKPELRRHLLECPRCGCEL